MSRQRLAVVVTHPVQYQVPLYRRLASHPGIDLTVFYGSDFGARLRRDPGFGLSLRWDRPLLDGYRWRLLDNLSPLPSIDPARSLGLINPGIALQLARGRFDALLIPGTWSATYWIAALAARALGLPILFRGEVAPPGPREGLRASLGDVARRRWFGKMAACLAIGEASAEFYRHYGVPEDRIFRAPYAVDNDFFRSEAMRWEGRREEAKRAVGVDPKRPVVLFVGKLIERKRPQDLLRALEALRTPATILFVGEGPLRSSLETEARERGLSAVFAGFRNQSELPACYAAADVFAFPSAFEPYGLVLNEAMCAGLPVVVSTGVMAARDLVRDGVNGRLHSPGDLAALGARLDELLADPETRKRMGAASSERISSWNYNACVDGILRALDQVACRSSRSSGKRDRAGDKRSSTPPTMTK